jgi:hypothetical protein
VHIFGIGFSRRVTTTHSSSGGGVTLSVALNCSAVVVVAVIDGDVAAAADEWLFLRACRPIVYWSVGISVVAVVDSLDLASGLIFMGCLAVVTVCA